MKCLFILFAVLLLNNNSNAQQDTSIAHTTKEDLLLKSRKQKTAGWIMIIGGTAIAIAGYTTYVNHVQNSSSIWAFADGNGLLVGTVGIAITTVGGILIRSSKRNKSKAMSMSFTNQPLNFYSKNHTHVASVPSLTLVFAIK